MSKSTQNTADDIVGIMTIKSLDDEMHKAQRTPRGIPDLQHKSYGPGATKKWST